MQSFWVSDTIGFGDLDSGLWHQMQLSMQPLRKTAVLMPGPSFTQKRWMLKTVAVAFFSISILGSVEHGLLKHGREPVKVLGEAADSNDQIFMLFGMIDSVKHLFS